MNNESNDLFEPVPYVSDADILRKIGANHPAFNQLAKLIGNNEKALRALRQESIFVRAHPELPRGSEFAKAVRGYLIANKLEWTQENLKTAAALHGIDRARSHSEKEES